MKKSVRSGKFIIDKNVFIKFYRPTCPHCVKLAPIFEDSKKGTFITDVRSIYKAAELDWQMDNATGNRVTEYNNVTAKVEADISENYVYCVKMNSYGEVKKIVVDNGNYHIESSAKINEISEEEISKSTGVAICTP